MEFVVLFFTFSPPIVRSVSVFIFGFFGSHQKMVDPTHALFLCFHRGDVWPFWGYFLPGSQQLLSMQNTYFFTTTRVDLSFSKVRSGVVSLVRPGHVVGPSRSSKQNMMVIMKENKNSCKLKFIQILSHNVKNAKAQLNAAVQSSLCCKYMVVSTRKACHLCAASCLSYN